MQGDCRYHEPPSAAPWLIVALTGLASGVAGLVLTETSSTKIERSAKPASNAATFTIVPTHAGATLGMTLTF